MTYFFTIFTNILFIILFIIIRVRAGTDYVGPWVRKGTGGWWVMAGCFRVVVSYPVARRFETFKRSFLGLLTSV